MVYQTQLIAQHKGTSSELMLLFFLSFSLLIGWQLSIWNCLQAILFIAV